MIKNHFQLPNGFSVMKNIFVKWVSGGPGFRIEVTLRASYGYWAGHTWSWAVRANKKPARAISKQLKCAESRFFASYSSPASRILTPVPGVTPDLGKLTDSYS